MGFILEKISKEDKKKIGLPIFGNYKWAIDKNLKAFFIPRGGAGFGENGIPATYFFELNINGEEIKIEVNEEKIKGLENELKYDVIFNIKKILVPNQFKNEVQSIKDLIIEAFKTWGRLGNPDFTKSVAVNFPDNSEILFKQNS